jgi:exodeoxyribonuclease VII large subunit
LPFENQNPQVYSVHKLTEKIQALLEDHLDFVWVEGEISNFSTPASGHYYMVLKDEKAQIRAVMFRLQARYLKFLPENGMKVIAQGKITVYAPRGEYQIILDYLEPMGVGALALAFEQLKKKLASQGIFDEAVKKPLPFLPQRVAVITSPTGAAVRDFLKIIRRRFANIEIVIVPVRVQGNEATADMIKALDLVNRELNVDVIVLTRGGGSLEDLWAFNQEKLALAIRSSHIPVVSAVGHEIDLTIADLAADLRAPTPSAAAELLVAEKETILARLKNTQDRLITVVGQRLKSLHQHVDHLVKSLQDPRKRLADTWMHLDEIHVRLARLMDLIIRDRRLKMNTERRALLVRSPVNVMVAMKQRLDFQRNALGRAINGHIGDRHMTYSLLEKRIRDLSPLSILKRGYSITRRLPEKMVLRDVLDVNRGDRVQVILAEGELECRVEEVEPDKKI